MMLLSCSPIEIIRAFYFKVNERKTKEKRTE